MRLTLGRDNVVPEELFFKSTTREYGPLSLMLSSTIWSEKKIGSAKKSYTKVKKIIVRKNAVVPKG
jgi:hypothetical protein